MDELEEKLKIQVRPLSWPINMGSDFKGVYNLYRRQLDLFTASKTHVEKDVIRLRSLAESQLDQLIGSSDASQIREDVELIEGVYESFEVNEYREGKLAPVFFGSAINNFGVKELLDTFIEIAPSPGQKQTTQRVVEAKEEEFSGFVFKIHANLDPKHRDRIAFLRVCSGRFERNKFYHHVRLGKNFRFSNPYTFMGSEKNVTEDALPGDVVGLYDTSNFKIGDTLTEGEKFMFTGIPTFSPEIFREVVNTNPLKVKQLEKGIRQLTDEGVAQLFFKQPGNRKIIGTVGELQFDVIRFRLEHEYGATCDFYPMQLHKACWITSKDKQKLKEFIDRKAAYIAWDKEERPVFLAETPSALTWTKDLYPDIEFHFISEYNLEPMKA
jgi:peptide chain release factor 3